MNAAEVADHTAGRGDAAAAAAAGCVDLPRNDEAGARATPASRTHSGAIGDAKAAATHTSAGPADGSLDPALELARIRLREQELRLQEAAIRFQEAAIRFQEAAMHLTA